MQRSVNSIRRCRRCQSSDILERRLALLAYFIHWWHDRATPVNQLYTFVKKQSSVARLPGHTPESRCHDNRMPRLSNHLDSAASPWQHAFWASKKVSNYPRRPRILFSRICVYVYMYVYPYVSKLTSRPKL